MTDTIADMLTRIRNALVAKHESVDVPCSTINIQLKYGPNKQRVIVGIKRISRPGLRVYARKDEIPKVLGGLGIAILSTSRGVMTDREARKLGVGGEVLAFVW